MTNEKILSMAERARIDRKVFEALPPDADGPYIIQRANGERVNIRPGPAEDEPALAPPPGRAQAVAAVAQAFAALDAQGAIIPPGLQAAVAAVRLTNTELFALRGGGPGRPSKAVAAVNSYQDELQEEYLGWVKSTAASLASAENDTERDLAWAAALTALGLLLMALGRRRLPEAAQLALGDNPWTPDLLQTITDVVRENDAYLTILRDDIGRKMNGAFGSPEVREALAGGAATAGLVFTGLLTGFAGRVARFAGEWWDLFNRAVGEIATDLGRPVYWLRDERAQHCDTCLTYGNTRYSSYEELLLITGGRSPANGTECRDNCRCRLIILAPDNEGDDEGDGEDLLAVEWGPDAPEIFHMAGKHDQRRHSFRYKGGYSELRKRRKAMDDELWNEYKGRWKKRAAKAKAAAGGGAKAAASPAEKQALDEKKAAKDKLKAEIAAAKAEVAATQAQAVEAQAEMETAQAKAEQAYREAQAAAVNSDYANSDALLAQADAKTATKDWAAKADASAKATAEYQAAEKALADKQAQIKNASAAEQAKAAERAKAAEQAKAPKSFEESDKESVNITTLSGENKTVSGVVVEPGIVAVTKAKDGSYHVVDASTGKSLGKYQSSADAMTEARAVGDSVKAFQAGEYKMIVSGKKVAGVNVKGQPGVGIVKGSDGKYRLINKHNGDSLGVFDSPHQALQAAKANKKANLAAVSAAKGVPSAASLNKGAYLEVADHQASKGPNATLINATSESVQSKGGLTDSELTAIRQYQNSSEVSGATNRVLWKGEHFGLDEASPMLQRIKGVDQALIKAGGAPVNMVVYRGQPPGSATYKLAQGLKLGDTYTAKGFDSTSIVRSSADSFGDGVTITYRVAKGTRGGYLNGLLNGGGNYAGEREFLMARGNRWKVTEWSQNVYGQIEMTVESVK